MIARGQPPVKQNPQSFLHCRKIAENRRKTQKRCEFNLQIGCMVGQAKRFEMASASSGLRHPASASCLGRHLRLAGRCPNNSSLFPPLAAVVVVVLCAYSAEELFIMEQCRAVCGPPGIAFSRVGSWRKTASAALVSCGNSRAAGRTLSVIAARCHLPRRGRFCSACR